MTDLVLTEGLKAAHLEAIHVAAAKIENAREDRDLAIVEAYRDGVPVGAIAEMAQVTRQRVWQIVNTPS